MTSAWRWIQEINDTCYKRKPNFKPDLGLLDMGDTSCAPLSTLELAARMIESMHKKPSAKECWLMDSLALKKGILKNTSLTVERWEWRSFLESEKERERLEKAAKGQSRKGGGGGWGPGEGGI